MGMVWAAGEVDAAGMLATMAPTGARSDSYARDPYPTLAGWREREPLHVDGDGTIVVTRHAEVSALLRDPRAARTAMPVESTADIHFSAADLDFTLAEAGDHHFDVVHDIAARVTTGIAIDVIAAGVLALLDFPDEADALCRDLSMLPLAAEEVLRYDPPVLSERRIATETIKLPSGVIPAGAAIELSIAGANHDPQVFVEPERWMCNRTPNRHLTVADAVVARACARVLGELLRRFAVIELDGFMRRETAGGRRTFVSLPVRVMPR